MYMHVSMSASLHASIGVSGRLQGSDIQGVFGRNYQRVNELSANYQCGFKTFSGSTERATCRCILPTGWLILIISYISIYVCHRISVGMVIGYYVSDGRLCLSVRYCNTLGIGWCVRRVYRIINTELSAGVIGNCLLTDLSTGVIQNCFSTELLQIIGSTDREWN